MQARRKEKIENILISIFSTFVINVLFILSPDFWANLFIGKKSLGLIITFQDVMWFFFILGIIEIRKRKINIKRVQKFEKNDYLPSRFEDLIDDNVLTDIIKKTKLDIEEESSILPYMILQISLQFRTNKSISLTSDFLTKQLDLALHEVEIQYNNLKYIIWLVPSLGFMGTVYGIGLAVSQLGEGSIDDPALLTKMASSLGVAFNTTLLALVLSVILQYLTQKSETQEENQINSFGKYILENLINKLVVRS